MTTNQAIHILVEMQKWRLGEKPYDNEYEPVEMPYSTSEYTKAINKGIAALQGMKALKEMIRKNGD